ncbi:CAF17-like 4Fe-4S cluster assembly/insertion protein YgfZ [Actinomyces weissii]|uniref:Folate-binding protein YgfZ n=1 Tax=Actinomyces weissii TaxID=675090 RepID=A0A7T7M9X9_9ACTO|nr:folate-binding protein YgfZ [Actinomyces weissii]QQM67631.1 folate-binding protein YgfZ [Actinomyces weissii]
MRPSALLSWPGAVAFPGDEGQTAPPGDGLEGASADGLSHPEGAAPHHGPGVTPQPFAGAAEARGLAPALQEARPGGPSAGAAAPLLVDATVPAHYGSPTREQVALLEGRAVTALASDVVEVTGPDRLSWLTTLSSQLHTGLGPQHPGVEALVLDAQGHVAHAYAAIDDGAATYLLTDAGRGPGLAQFLDSMRFMLRVQVQVREDLAVLGVMGPGRELLEAAAAGARALVGTWHDPWPGVVEGGTAYDVGLAAEGRPFRHPGAGWAAWWMLVRAESLLEVVKRFLSGAVGGALPSAAAGAVPAAGVAGSPGGLGAVGAAAGAVPGSRFGRCLAGAMAWEALRVEAGRPRLVREADERSIPNELDWLRTAVHLSKGCYPGQETVARTLNLGRPPRRLTILQLDGLSGDLPQPGAVVRLGDRPVGRVTSVAWHHELGPIALALLRRSTPLEAALLVDVEGPEPDPAAAAAGARVAAAQEPLVTPEGKARVSPERRPGEGLRPVGGQRPGLLR